jgi:hypothetical protein
MLDEHDKCEKLNNYLTMKEQIGLKKSWMIY